MVGDVPPERLDSGVGGERLRLAVVAAVIRRDGDADALQGVADRRADAARAAGDDRYPCHVPFSPECYFENTLWRGDPPRKFTRQ